MEGGREGVRGKEDLNLPQATLKSLALGRVSLVHQKRIILQGNPWKETPTIASISPPQNIYLTVCILPVK